MNTLFGLFMWIESKLKEERQFLEKLQDENASDVDIYIQKRNIDNMELCLEKIQRLMED